MADCLQLTQGGSKVKHQCQSTIMGGACAELQHCQESYASSHCTTIWGIRTLNPISMAGLSRWPGEGRYPQNINGSLGLLRDRFLDPSSSPHTLHHWVPSYKHMVFHTIAMQMTHSSISRFDQLIQR